MKKLVLFDIDGTLLTVRGVGARVMIEAIAEVMGLELNTANYSLSGKTDTQIAIELVERSGGSREQVWAQLEVIWARYLDQLQEALPTLEPTTMPGVLPLLHQLQTCPDLVLGLLTGNVERAAWQKLQWATLGSYFQLGAFGDYAPQRQLLPERAVAKAQALTGQTFAGKDIIIIGDTPNDIQCGQHLGVKSIAVATGKFSTGQLALHQPDHLFADLSPTEQVVAAIWA